MASRHYGEFEMLDYSESKSSFSFSFGAITALSLPGFLTEFGALRTALDGITIGTICREKWVGDETVLSNVPPVDPNAQRELFWRVTYEESPLTIHSRGWEMQIPTPDTALLNSQRDEADYANAFIAAFITAFEALVTSPEGNPIVITTIDFAGRKY